MAFIKHRGYHEITAEVSADEQYTIIAQVLREPDFSRPLLDLAFPADGSEPAILGWRGFVDTDTGEDLTLTPDNAREVFSDPFVEGAVWRALGALRGQALSGELLRKNSSTPAATGPAAGPAATTGD